MLGFHKRWAVYGRYENGRVERMVEYWTERGAQNFVNWVVKNTSWVSWQESDGAPALIVARIDELG